MGRLPALRVSYNNDANYLFRLVSAMERDSNRPLPWLKQAIAKTQELATFLANPPSETRESGKTESAGAKSKKNGKKGNHV